MKGARAASSRRAFYLGLLAVLVLGAGAISWAMNRAKTSSVVRIVPADTIGAKAQGHVLGNEAAPVEIVEFADFECPICATWATVTEPDVRQRLINTGQAKLRLYAFQINTGHQNSVAGALAAECAADQNKFWEMHDKLFEGQNDWNSIATANPKPVIEGYAKALGLDMSAWNACYDGRKYVGRIAGNANEAIRRGANSTPTFLIGERMVNGSQPYDVIKALVDSARMKGTPAAAAPAADTTKK